MTMEKIHDCNKCFLAYCNCHDRRISCDDEEYSGDRCEWYEPYLKPEELTKHETRYYGDVPFKLVASEYHCPLCGEVLEELQEQCGNNECGCWIDWED